MGSDLEGISDRRKGGFTTTHWSIVLAAKEGALPESEQALETLCGTYWYPLYAYIRRKGYSPHDAQDVTQGFFARFLEERYLRQVHPSKGRFRCFLLACLEHYLAKEKRRGRARKRGGENRIISVEAPLAEDRYRLEPRENTTPEMIYKRRWALTVLEQAMMRLRKEYASNGKERLFEALKGRLSDRDHAAPYAEVASCLQMSEAAVRKAAQRMREHYGECLRSEIAQTVATESDVDEEIRYLRSVLQR